MKNLIRKADCQMLIMNKSWLQAEKKCYEQFINYEFYGNLIIISYKTEENFIPLVVVSESLNFSKKRVVYFSFDLRCSMPNIISKVINDFETFILTMIKQSDVTYPCTLKKTCKERHYNPTKQSGQCLPCKTAFSCPSNRYYKNT